MLFCVCEQKVVERFHRNKSKPASEDVAERVFLLAERRVEVTYHLEDNRYIPSTRRFIKPQKLMETMKAEDFTADMVSSFQVRTKRTDRELTAWSNAPTLTACVCMSGGSVCETAEDSDSV